MSARVRGLVLSGDASQIVVEPTGGEVARFGRGQAVAVVALDARPVKSDEKRLESWDDVRNRFDDLRQRFMDRPEPVVFGEFDFEALMMFGNGAPLGAPPVGMTSSVAPRYSAGVAAELRTLCGCSKLVMLRCQGAGRPPETVQVPIFMTPASAMPAGWLSSSTMTRTFRRQQLAHDDRLIYMESPS